MTYENIVLEHEGRVAIMAINRPDKRNALNLATRREIARVLDTIQADTEIGVLVITGVGDKSFISGRT